MQANWKWFAFNVATELVELQPKHFALTSGKYCQSADTACGRWDEERSKWRPLCGRKTPSTGVCQWLDLIFIPGFCFICWVGSGNPRREIPKSRDTQSSRPESQANCLSSTLGTRQQLTMIMKFRMIMVLMNVIMMRGNSSAHSN